MMLRLHLRPTLWLGLALALASPTAWSQTTNVTLSGLTNNDYSTAITGTLAIDLGFLVDYLVVGGGGGGAGRDSGGGGGGGGVLTNGGGSILTNFTIGQNGLLVSSGNYAVTVGGGGAGSPGVLDGSGTGSAGGNSAFGSGLSAVGGGGGGNYASNGASGGSGGGGGRQTNFTGGAGTAGPPRQGYNGGNGSNGTDLASDSGGGGGGAGGAGGTAVKNSTAGSGGAGVESFIAAGTSRFYAGGGGGAGHRSNVSISSGSGGSGVGGAGAATSSVLPGNGVANSGGGGGASRAETGTGGSGGSGTVAIRYLGPSIATGITGGTTASYTFYDGNYTVHRFETVGSGSLTLDTSDPSRLDGSNFGTLTGSGALEFNGPGRLTLFRNNTYAGGTTVSAGTLVVGQRFVEATLYTGAIGAGPASIAAGAMLAYDLNSEYGTFSLSNTYQGAGTLQVRSVGTGELGSNAAGFAGTVWLKQGVLKLQSTDALGTTVGETWVNPNFITGGQAILDLNGKAIVGETLRVGDGSQTIGAVNVQNSSTTPASWSGPTITDCNLFILDTPQGDIAMTGVISGNANLSKFGPRKLTLAAANTYSGATTLQVGTLAVNGRTGTGAFESMANTRLEGTGTIAGAATIGGTHAPGNSPGIQTFESDLTYDGGRVEWELIGNSTSGRGTTFDGIDVAGNLEFKDGTLNLLDLVFNAAGSSVNWDDSFWAANRTWQLYDLDGGTTTGIDNFSITIQDWLDSTGRALSQSSRAGATFNVGLDGQDVVINYAVPEPSTLALAAAAGLAGLMLVRRRKPA
jgi:autotransporter-associated beta strand protein